MTDFRNSTFLFVLSGIVAGFIAVNCILFIIKAWREGKRIGLTSKTMKNAIISSSIFSVVPSLSILVAVLTLSGALGLALPWGKLNYNGSIAYDLTMAETAAQAFGTTTKVAILDKTVFSAIAWSMSLGTICTMFIVAFFVKKIQGGINKAKVRDSAWITLLITAMFMGLISVFLGSALGGGIISILTLLTSGAIMGIFGLLIKKTHLKWLEIYALPVSMIGGMGFAILYSALIYGGAR